MFFLGLTFYYISDASVPCCIYDLFIGEDGQLYEGCGLDRALSYAGTQNAGGPLISVAFVGTFTARVPNVRAVAALNTLFSSVCLTVSQICLNHLSVS